MIRDGGYEMGDARYGIRDTGCEMRDAGNSEVNSRRVISDQS